LARELALNPLAAKNLEGNGATALSMNPLSLALLSQQVGPVGPIPPLFTASGLSVENPVSRLINALLLEQKIWQNKNDSSQPKDH